MAQALYEDITRRSRQPAAGRDWTGYKHIRVFKGLPGGDMAYHRANELSPGAVLPAKWGGVATSRAIDPRLTYAPETGQSKSAATQIYTEWTEITTISGWVEDFWTPYETRSSGSRIGTLERFQGERTCIILDSEVGTLAPQYNVALGASHVFPGATGVLAARLYGYRLEPMAERPLCSRLTMLYTDPTVIQALEPGRAVLMVRVEGKESKIDYLADGTPIDGPDLTTGFSKWELVSGDNVVLKPQARVVIRTAATDANIPEIWYKIGHTNSNTFTYIGNAPPGTMQFQGASVSGQLINRKYWGIDYEFKYRPLDADGKSQFGGTVQSRKFTKQTISRPRQKVDPNDAKKTVNDGSKEDIVTIWHPEATSESRTLPMQSSDFSSLNGQLGWY